MLESTINEVDVGNLRPIGVETLEKHGAELFSEVIMKMGRILGPNLKYDGHDSMKIIPDELGKVFADILGGTNQRLNNRRLLQTTFKTPDEVMMATRYGRWWLNQATKKSSVAINSVFDQRGEITSLDSPTTDSLLIPLAGSEIQQGGSDCGLLISFFWDGKATIQGSRKGSGDGLKSELELLDKRLKTEKVDAIAMTLVAMPKRQ